MIRPCVRLSPDRLDVVVFDLDGVLTDTASLHEAAWKETFDAFLRSRAEPFSEFTRADYLQHVDGRARRDGVRAFLASRRIELPDGREIDPPEAITIEGLARRKNEAVQERLEHDAMPLPGAEALLESLCRARIRVAVASSSANAGPVLRATGLARFVEARVDGLDLSRLNLPGKPDPAMFLEALRQLGVGPERAALFEDAIAGVEAGRRVGFAFVIGVGGGGGGDTHAMALRGAGADEVVRDLSEVVVA